MKSSLELLKNVRIASPCTADWNEMTGNDNVRFCGKCSKHVYNFSSLTSDQVVGLIREKEGDLCSRFFRRADGTILTADCPVGVHHRIRRGRRVFAFAASLAGILGFSGCTKLDDGAGTSTGKPPARQEQSVKPAAIDPPPKKFELVLGWCDCRDFVPAPIPNAGEAPEQLPAPREVRID
jgi:hypothetical protein